MAYTDPEVAWVGLTEDDAKARGVAYEKGTFPWAASARSLTLGRGDGLTKLLFDAGTKRLLGAGIVGVNAGDLIAEAALAIEMGADAADVGLTVHPHPTLSETLASRPKRPKARSPISTCRRSGTRRRSSASGLRATLAACPGGSA